MASSAMATVGINTGFESPFTLGNIDGQQGWVAVDTANNHVTNVTISNVDPASGTQHLRLVGDPAETNDSGAKSPIVPLASGTPTKTSFALKVGGVTPGPTTGGADYFFQLADRSNPSLGREVALMEFDFVGNIDVDTGGASLVPIGTWTPGVYASYDISVDPSAQTITYSRNGTALFTGPTIPAASQGSDTPDQIQFVSDNFQQEGEFAHLDNLSLVPVVPEPACAALVMATALGPARWLRGRRGGRSYMRAS
jgi:hypothetical protein